MSHAKPLLPTSIWMLGFVSMLMDISSEMIHSLLPMFMVGTLGASVWMVGLVEGLGESTALLVKIFSGSLSDYLGKRKGIVLAGYALGAFTKPLFAIAGGIGTILTARLIDRVGKGVRSAPRDALISDIVPAAHRGAAFGLRQSLDTIGAVIGPLLAVGLMIAWQNDYRTIFWVAAIPGLLAVLLLHYGVTEPDNLTTATPSPLSLSSLKKLGAPFWWVVAIGGVFTLARFSEAFLVLVAQKSGIREAYVPLVMVGMNVIYAITAYPFGKLSDRLPAEVLLTAGLVVLIIADGLLASGGTWWVIGLGVMLWGVHMGMTQGLLSALVADTAPSDLRGTAFGLFNLVSGICLLLASAGAGLLWDTLGAASTFYAGAICCVLALFTLWARWWWRKTSHPTR
ncbi:MFS transporter [Leeia sp. TBRC 13508]|uniref:MFS transporter n=1 Tax=Leeia speluncae TaxID=2884804 RepID=A0ABS8D3T4_9NEIS|nr:MFS transporter [Leeia speluncae]MCB6182866.1 MFS transporter [Leeia speluncae]